MKLVCPGGKYEIAPDSWPIGNNQRVENFPCFKKGPRTLRQFYDICFTNFSSQECIIFENERFTYAQIWAQSSAFANALIDTYGIGKGDRVVINLRNYPEWCIAFIAATSIGAVAVPMNGWWKGAEIEYGLRDCSPKVLVCDETRLKRSMPYIGNLGIRPIVVRSKGQYPPSVMKYEDLIARYAHRDMPSDQRCQVDDFAAIMYTSGTTSHPKGVVQTHRGYAQQMTGTMLMNELRAKFGPKPKNPHSMLCPIPLFHVTGLIHILLAGFASARKLTLMSKWDAGLALRLIERERVTVFLGVPTMGQDLMEHPDFEKFDTSTLQIVSGGGGPTPTSQVFKTERKFRNAMAGQGYGLTETTGGISFITGEEYKQRPGSCGKPHPTGVHCLLQDLETGEIIPPGKGEGELLIKSSLIMNHYWQKPKKTDTAIVEIKGHGQGWFRTGDIAEIDKDGYIYLKDRAKDIIIRGGENISCAEVESAFFESSGEYILECAVFGIKDNRLGEVPGIVVVLKPGIKNVSACVLYERVQNKIAKFKIPKIEHILFSENILPRGATGKILKRVVRDKVNEALSLGAKAKL